MSTCSSLAPTMFPAGLKTITINQDPKERAKNNFKNEKCRKHSPAARAFHISLVFSNACRVLSQCNTQVRLLYLLNNKQNYVHNIRLTFTANFYTAKRICSKRL